MKNIPGYIDIQDLSRYKAIYSKILVGSCIIYTLESGRLGYDTQVWGPEDRLC